MKFWRRVQMARQKEGAEKWPKHLAKMYSRMFNRNPGPTPLFMGLCMDYMPIEIEGPTQDGSKVVVNPWDIK